MDTSRYWAVAAALCVTGCGDFVPATQPDLAVDARVAPLSMDHGEEDLIVYTASGEVVQPFGGDPFQLDGASFLFTSVIDASASPIPGTVWDRYGVVRACYPLSVPPLVSIIGSGGTLEGQYVVSEEDRLCFESASGRLRLSHLGISGEETFGERFEILSTVVSSDVLSGVELPTFSTVDVLGDAPIPGCNQAATGGSDSDNWFLCVNGAALGSLVTVRQGSWDWSKFWETLLELGHIAVLIGEVAAGHIYGAIPTFVFDLAPPSIREDWTASSYSNVDLRVTDPMGRSIGPGVSTIPGAVYLESDFSMFTDRKDVIVIDDPLPGTYTVEVIPEAGALPGDRFSLVTTDRSTGEVRRNVLALDQVIPATPQGYEDTVGEVTVTKDACKKGGWRELGFRNQGQCIKFANTGK